ncbi:hypothetical protein OBBRIDRAFT_529174 [Obba rivulosa]|uniref:Uncharacterized protein n=1 Tax=Obba rivulosa TaxID=1052685 RepID=A0A8E2AZW6_9APHY|nr:hypothetical protein OBBRIDRAFT_529174 [Obba rivulosa]
MGLPCDVGLGFTYNHISLSRGGLAFLHQKCNQQAILGACIFARVNAIILAKACAVANYANDEDLETILVRQNNDYLYPAHDISQALRTRCVASKQWINLLMPAAITMSERRGQKRIMVWDVGKGWDNMVGEQVFQALLETDEMTQQALNLIGRG